MALLQRQQSFPHHQKNAEDAQRRPSVATKASPPGAASGSGGGGGGGGERGVRRASSFLGLTGPRTAATTTGNMGTSSTNHLNHPATSTTSTSTINTNNTTTTNNPNPNPNHRLSTGGPLLPHPPPPTLFGLLASKRLAKRFASRFQRRRLGTMSSLMSSGGGAPPVMAEPTYRMEPYRKFRPSEVEMMLKSMLEERMDKFRYSARICANMCKVLGDDIKDRVKQMNFDRYKIVSNVVIGQKKDQAVIMCSRCAWDEKLDNYASYTFQNEHIFCTATVFGIYME